MIPAVVFFDIDGTLTESKQRMTPPMAQKFSALLSQTKVALTSGGMKELAQTQIVAHLGDDANLSNLYLLPTSGAQLLIHTNGGWNTVYEELLSKEEVARVESVLLEAARETGAIDFSRESYGERIENRGSQVSLSALGQQAPVSEKEAWDPTREKRDTLLGYIIPLLPDFDVKLGGLTTVDVTKKGINKAYGVRKLSEYLSISISDMLYIGDALFPGGNDEVVKETGMKTKQTSGPDETMELISAILS